MASSAKLKPAQVRILQALARHQGGLTRGEIHEKARATVALLAGFLGPTSEEDCKASDEKYGYPSLHSLGYVQVERYDLHGRLTDYFVLTESGLDAAAKHATKERPNAAHRIPREVLLPVALKFKDLCTYTWEDYSDTAITQIRDNLQGDYSHVPLASIKQQLINLRKTGALKDEKEETYPGWYVAYRDGEHFGEVEKWVLAHHGNACALNDTHTEDIRVCHRTLSTLGDERVKDCVALCKQCRHRARRALPPIPTIPPA